MTHSTSGTYEDYIRGQTVVITGAAGSIGRELTARVLQLAPREVRAVDNNESDLFSLQQEHQAAPCTALLGDVRDLPTMISTFKGADIVFHLAALKHVPLCERSPMEAVQTNIAGVQNVVTAAVAANVRKLVNTSSDKAVNPTSVMGVSKLMGERLISAASLATAPNQSYISVRFGNVIGSRGSVVPIFEEQIRSGKPVTVTDHQMTRFVMTRRESVNLILEAMQLGEGGEVFITKMRAVRIIDLAKSMIGSLAPRHGRRPESVEIKLTGYRPGEKICEELMNTEEVRRTIEFDKFYCVLPALSDLYARSHRYLKSGSAQQLARAYTSDGGPYMAIDEIASYLDEDRTHYH